MGSNLLEIPTGITIREDALNELTTLIPDSRTAMMVIFSSNIRYPPVMAEETKDDVYTDYLLTLLFNGLSIDISNVRLCEKIQLRFSSLVEPEIVGFVSNPRLTVNTRAKDIQYSPSTEFDIFASDKDE